MRWQALKALVGWENGENEKPRAIRLIFSIIHILIIHTTIIILLIITSIAIITILFVMMRESHQGLATKLMDTGGKGRNGGQADAKPTV